MPPKKRNRKKSNAVASPKRSSKRNKKKLVIYIAPKGNKKDKAFESTLTEKQKKYWKEEIFTDVNIIKASSLLASKEKKDGHINDRDVFITNLITEKVTNEVEIKRYKETANIPFDEVFIHVKKKFAHCISEYKKKSGITKTESSTSTTKTNNMRPSEINLEQNQRLRKTKGIIANKDFMEKMPHYQHFHYDESKNETTISADWNMYSFIHTLYESWNFVLYNGSHMIKNDGYVHYKSRIVLEFPSDIPLLLVFHGNLIHSGAESKYGDTKFSMTYSPDVRAFAYVNRTGNQSSNRKGISTRSAYSSVDSRQVTHEDSITTTTFKRCEKMYNNSNKCTICDRYKNELVNDYGAIIDLKQAFNEYTTYPVSSDPNTAKKPVIGDLKKHGWAVYYGLQTRHVDVVGTLFQDIRELLNRPKTITGVSWYDAQAEPKNENGSGRMKLKISTEYLGNPSQANSYLQSIITFFHKIEKEVLQRIKGFEFSKIDEGHLLHNKKKIIEQKPHKDFEPLPDTI